MSPEDQSLDVKRVKEVVTALGEHFDTVHIFVTRHEAGQLDGTKHISLGSGNWFARYGQIQAWMTAVDQDHRNIAGHTKDY